MLKVEIKKGTAEEKGRVLISAEGSVSELLNDMALLVSGVYAQFGAADKTTAEFFRIGLQNMAADPNSPFWKISGSQTGIIFKKPDMEGEE